MKRAPTMNDHYIVTVYVMIDDLLKAIQHHTDGRAGCSDAEILTVAIVAAQAFQNHHERTLCLMQRLGYIGQVSVSRFNRRLHKLVEVLYHLGWRVGEAFQGGKIYIIDTCPLPVCKRVRASRCRKVKGRAFYGYCASRDEHYFGWQLHLVCSAEGIPVAFEMLPAKWDELVGVQDLLAGLPEGSVVVADKGYISQKDELLAWSCGGVRLVPRYRKNMRGNSAEDTELLNTHRRQIEAVNSQLEKMGIQRLHASTNEGFAFKVLASLVALMFHNALK
jgi:IS5 family transposase